MKRSQAANRFVPAEMHATKELPRPARAILDAARQILRDQGFGALTLQAVASAAGQHKASIGYYFGNKAGLVSALLESVARDAVTDFVSRASETVGDERLERYVTRIMEVCADEQLTLEFLEVLPYAVRDPEARANMALVYQWYREVNRENLQVNGDGKDGPEGLAALMSAVADGLSIQTALHVDDRVVSAAWTAWIALLEASHPSRERSQAE